MNITSRQNAISLGLKFYFTGKACKHGHISKRFCHTCNCYECSKIRAMQWAKNNLDKSAAIAKRYAASNGELLKAKYSEWLQENPNYHKEWASNNRQSQRDTASRYRAAHPERVLATNRTRRAKLAGSIGKHTKNDVDLILTKQNGKCAFCFVKMNGVYHVDHIMPLFLGGSNWPENLQCLCPTCNVRKGAKHPNEWAKDNGRLL